MLPARLSRWVVQYGAWHSCRILCQQTVTQLITCTSSPVHVTYTEIKHRFHYTFVVGKGRQTRIHQNGAKSISMKKLRVNNNHYTVHTSTCFTKTNCTRTCQYCNAGMGITACDSKLRWAGDWTRSLCTTWRCDDVTFDESKTAHNKQLTGIAPSSSEHLVEWMMRV